MASIVPVSHLSSASVITDEDLFLVSQWAGTVYQSKYVRFSTLKDYLPSFLSVYHTPDRYYEGYNDGYSAGYKNGQSSGGGGTTTYTVTFKQIGDYTGTSTQNVAYGGTISTSELAVDGYSIVGYYTDSSGTSTYDVSSKIYSAKTIYVKYATSTKYTYKDTFSSQNQKPLGEHTYKATSVAANAYPHHIAANLNYIKTKGQVEGSYSFSGRTYTILHSGTITFSASSDDGSGNPITKASNGSYFYAPKINIYKNNNLVGSMTKNDLTKTFSFTLDDEFKVTAGDDWYQMVPKNEFTGWDPSNVYTGSALTLPSSQKGIWVPYSKMKSGTALYGYKVQTNYELWG